MNISALCNPFRQLLSRESHSTKKTSGSTKTWNPESGNGITETETETEMETEYGIKY